MHCEKFRITWCFALYESDYEKSHCFETAKRQTLKGTLGPQNVRPKSHGILWGKLDLA